MTKKIKKGYDWAEEQQEKWEAIADEKLEQLGDFSRTHLDWFSKHATISDILTWKRPIIDSKKNNNIPKKHMSDSPDLPPTKMEVQLPLNNEFKKKIATDPIDEEKTDLLEGDEILTLIIDNDSTNTHDSQIQQQVNNDQEIYSQQDDILPSGEEINLVVSKNINNRPQSPMIEKEKASAVHTESLDNTKSTVENSNMQPNIDAIHNVEISIPTTTQHTIATTKRVSMNSKTSEEDFTMHTPDLIMDMDTQQTQKVPTTPENYSQVEMQRLSDAFRLDPSQSVHENNEKRNETLHNSLTNKYDDGYEDEENDEIQLVVSNRNFKDEYMQSERNLLKSPIRNTITQSVISPPPNVESTKALQIPAVRHQSPFMSRLFQVGSNVTRDRSLKEDSPSPINYITTRPKSTASTSTINSTRSKKISLSTIENYDNKRPLEIVSAEIEVSDAMPQSRFKRPKALTKKSLQDSNQNTNIPESIADQSQTEENVLASEEKEKEKKEEKVEIPFWALEPQLSVLLEKQAGLDPEKIFGRMTPLDTEAIFYNSHEYMATIPEQAPP